MTDTRADGSVHAAPGVWSGTGGQRLPRLCRPGLWLAGTLWVASALFGFGRLLSYAATPGASGQPERSWPAGSRLHPDPARANLVMVVHPRCPCTRASLEELNQVMAVADGRVQVHALFFRPAGFSPGWERTDLWRSAAAIPGVEVSADAGGREARRFGLATSGQVALYDRGGRLVFSGGITGSRGHVGDNIGQESVVQLLMEGRADHSASPVYGCQLFADVGARKGKPE